VRLKEMRCLIPFANLFRRIVNVTIPVFLLISVSVKLYWYDSLLYFSETAGFPIALCNH